MQQTPAKDLTDMLRDIGVAMDEPGEVMSAEEYLNPEDTITDVSG